MKSFFLAIAILSIVPVAYAQTPVMVGMSEYEVIDNQAAAYEVLALMQAESSPDQTTDEGGEVPYKGFNVIAGIMVAATIGVLVFVVLRIFRGTHEKRKKEEQ